MPVFDLETTTLVAGGDALGRLPDGRAVFVAGGAPDEHVRVALTKESKRWARATMAAILRPSPDRVTPPHPRELLGGATWAHLSYAAQLRAKQAIVEQTLARIGGVTDVPILPIIASPNQWGYRNRVAFTVGEQNGTPMLGTLTPGSDTVIEIANGSALFGEIATGLLERVRTWAVAAPRTIWSPRESRDGLRSVIFRRGIHTNDLTVHVVATANTPIDHSLISYLEDTPVTSIVWSINDARDQVTRFETTTVLLGKRQLTERVGGIDLSYDVTSFFQANVEAAELLLSSLRGHLAPTTALVDLYAGVGLLGLGAASAETPLTLVEAHPQAVEDAQRNANLRHRSGSTIFVATTAARYLAQNRLAKETTVIVDPPRTGLESGVIEHLLRDRPARIAYVSCDPATLARDLKLLAPSHQPTLIQPFDFFPQTPHIETLVMLSDKNQISS